MTSHDQETSPPTSPPPRRTGRPRTFRHAIPAVVKLEAHDYERLKRFARRSGYTASHWMRQGILDVLSRHEFDAVPQPAEAA